MIISVHYDLITMIGMFSLNEFIFIKFNIFYYTEMCQNTHKAVQLVLKGSKSVTQSSMRILLHAKLKIV